MVLDEAIKHCEEVAKEQEELYGLCPASESENHCDGTKDCKTLKYGKNKGCLKCAEEHKQLAAWLKELRVFKSRKGQWLRMSDLPEQEDDRYKCSYCGNVIHYKNKMDLYTFNKWCGRCGSDNGRKIEV